MPHLRSLLLALLLPALLLPDGMSLCLKRLIGERACAACRTCCCARPPDPTRPAMKAPACKECCLSLPSTDRSVDSIAKKRSDEQRAATHFVAPPSDELFTARLDRVLFVASRDVASAESPPPRISLPLRL